MSNAEASSSKHKDRRSKKKDKKEKRKHKHEARDVVPKVEGPFEHRVQRMRLAIPPKFSADWMEGVRESLDGMLMR